MARHRDESNIKNTCPKIDEVISAIKSINWTEDSYHDETMLIQIMEEIREANSKLRDWGNGVYREKEELESEITDLKKEIDNLKYDISNYEKEILKLENSL